MAYLLTFGVLAFQLAILVTIIGAGRAGRRSLFFVTLCWVVFTLFGSIFTAGLLLLQLFTILVAYAIGRTVSAPAANQQQASVPQEPRKKITWPVIIFLIIAGTITGKMLGRWSAGNDIEQLKQVRAARALQTPASAVVPSPATGSDYELLLHSYEQRYPELNPDSAQFNAKITDLIAERMNTYRSEGLSAPQALTKSISDYASQANTAPVHPSSGYTTDGLWSPLPPNDGSQKFQKCWDQYYATVSNVGNEVPIGKYSAIETTAQNEMKKCLKR